MVRFIFRRSLALCCLAAILASVSPVQGQALELSKPVVYEIEMTTTFVVPAGNDKIDQIRFYHALPTLRSWSPEKAKYGATKLTTSPKGADEQTHKESDSRYMLLTIDGAQKPGTKLTFTTSMTIESPNRTLNLKAVKTTWKDYEAKAADKSAVVDAEVAKAVHPELAALATKFKADLPPAQAVQAMCQWIATNLKYDASVTFASSDVESIMKKKCGHCGHQATILQQLTASAGIPYRMVWGLNLYSPDARKGELYKVRTDYVNIHTWAEVYLPKVGWVEVDPALGEKAFSTPSHLIQNNRWFQNYSIWMRESGANKQPTWTAIKGGFRSDYGVENIINYKKK